MKYVLSGIAGAVIITLIYWQNIYIFFGIICLLGGYTCF